MKNVKKIICFTLLYITLCSCIKDECNETFDKLGQKFKNVLERRYFKTKVGPLRGDSGERLLLTPYLRSGKVEEARKLSIVNTDHLVDNMTSHAGFITVDKTYNSNLWFWYFPVEETSVENAPLVIWLQGGPGASSLFGLFEELGPFSVNQDGSDLIENEHSWHKSHSLLFIDNPVGTGFSFTDSEEGYATNQTMIGKQLYEFIIQFLQIYYELKDVPLYITGESYAGKHIPSFAYEIHKRNPTAETKINMQGLAIGNGFIDPITMMDYSSYLFQIGLVDNNVVETMQSYERETERSILIGNYTRAFRYFGATLGTFIYESEIYNVYNYVYEYEIGIGGPFSQFVQRPEIRKALHVGDAEFSSIGTVYEKLIGDFMTSAKPWLEELLEHYKVMLYSGQMDIIVAYPLSIRTYRSLNWSATEEYHKAPRKPWYFGETVAGYSKRAGNLLEVFVRNAGHMVPTDQPERSLLLLKSFINDVPLNEEPKEEGNKKKGKP